MKSYIFDFNKKNNKNNEFSDYLNELIDEAYNNYIPYWGEEKEEKPKVFKLPFTFDELIGKNTKKSLLENSNFNLTKDEVDLYDRFNKIIDTFGKYYNNEKKNSYDMKIAGVPVNFFGDFIQIGSTIIPTYAPKSYIYSLAPQVIQNIFEISIKIETTTIKY